MRRSLIDRDAKAALIGMVVAFIIIPAALGFVGASDWWADLVAHADEQRRLAQDLFYPLD